MSNANNFAIDKIAAEAGYETPEKMLMEYRRKYGSMRQMARAIGVSQDCLRKRMIRLNLWEPTSCQKKEPQKGNNVFTDARPTDLQGPWKNPKKSPCSACRYELRAKRNPGCENCLRRDEYNALQEPGPPTPGSYGEFQVLSDHGGLKRRAMS